MAANPLTSDDYYFEVEIVDTGLIAAIGKKYSISLVIRQVYFPSSTIQKI